MNKILSISDSSDIKLNILEMTEFVVASGGREAITSIGRFIDKITLFLQTPAGWISIAVILLVLFLFKR